MISSLGGMISPRFYCHIVEAEAWYPLQEGRLE